MKTQRKNVEKTCKAFTISNDVLEYIDEVRGYVPRSTFIDMILRSWMETDQEIINAVNLENQKLVNQKNQTENLIICD